jgi:thermitase
VKRIFLTLAIAAVAATSWTQSKGNVAPITYTQIKGVKEFSGQMIARPVQVTQMLERGMQYSQILALQRTARNLVAPLTKKYVNATDEYIIDIPAGKDENKLSAELMSTGAFQYVEPNWTVYPTIIPNDPFYSSQWAHPKIQSPSAWDLFRGTPTVIIALCDTGVRLDHEDFQGALVSGYNSASGVPQSGGGQVNDINGHGSHTAGIAAAQANNAKGIAGVGWNFKIMPIRVTNSSGGGSSIAALTDGARWAADNGARVISTSYSGVDAAAVQTTGNYIKTQRNGIYVWAAGNAGQNLNWFDHVDVTIVGATDSGDNRASFSNYGPAMDIVAPGVSIYSCYNSSSSGYTWMDGTSMACPCAAGVAAMIIGANPSAVSGANAESVLYATVDDLGAPGKDTNFGWGRVNLNKAVRYVYNNYPFQPVSAAGFLAIVNGTVQDATYADNVYQTYQTVTRSKTCGIDYTSNTSLLSIGGITLTVVSKAQSAGFTQNIEMFDYPGNQWVLVDTRAASTSNMTVNVNPSNPSRFVQAGTGQMKARISLFTASSFAGTTGYIDMIAFKTTPP